MCLAGDAKEREIGDVTGTWTCAGTRWTRSEGSGRRGARGAAGIARRRELCERRRLRKSTRLQAADGV